MLFQCIVLPIVGWLVERGEDAEAFVGFSAVVATKVLNERITPENQSWTP